MNKQKGFTLIELLVVIAIISLLASITLASLNSAREKGADAAVKSSLNSMRAQAEIYCGNQVNASTCYSGLCTADTIITSALNAAKINGGATLGPVTAIATAGQAGQVTCHASTTAAFWAIEAPLKGGGFYCAGSIGLGTTTAVSTLGANETDCQ
jgi:prepilin-type N-terminal cleavage/methylation domain-containing protein